MKVRNDVQNMREWKLATLIFFKYTGQFQSEYDSKGGIHVLLNPFDIRSDFDLLVLFSAGWYIDKNHHLSLDNTLPEWDWQP